MHRSLMCLMSESIILLINYSLFLCMICALVFCNTCVCETRRSVCKLFTFWCECEAQACMFDSCESCVPHPSPLLKEAVGLNSINCVSVCVSLPRSLPESLSPPPPPLNVSIPESPLSVFPFSVVRGGGKSMERWGGGGGLGAIAMNVMSESDLHWSKPS